MAGARKVAILTILLNRHREVGSRLLASLDKDLSRTVSEHMHNMGSLDPEEVKAIESRFYQEVGKILSEWVRHEQ